MFSPDTLCSNTTRSATSVCFVSSVVIVKLLQLQFLFYTVNLFNVSPEVMRFLLLAAVVCLSPAAVCGDGKKKLQIGIKKRVDNCPVKSRKGDVLNMHYTGKLEDGTEFDSSVPRDRPFTFTLGSGQVIKGWDQGLLGMCEGEKRKLVIPAELGYGDRGAPPKIPGGATLIFEVELLSIERKAEL